MEQLQAWIDTLRRNWWGILAVYVSVLATSYLAIWAVLEPLDVPATVELLNSTIDRRLFHVVVSILAASHFSVTLTILAEYARNGDQHVDVRRDVTHSDKKRILFLSANPIDTARLRVEDEIREIENAIRRSNHSDEFELIHSIGVRKSELHSILTRHSPHFLHISTHASQDNLIFESSSGSTEILTGEQFDRLLRTFKNEIQVVVLNAKYPADTCEQLARHVDFVIACTDGALADQDAIQFAKGFYEAIGNNSDLQQAFESACAVQFTSATAHAKFELFSSRIRPTQYTALSLE